MFLSFITLKGVKQVIKNKTCYYYYYIIIISGQWQNTRFLDKMFLSKSGIVPNT